MVAAVAVTPASGSVIATTTACRVTCTGVPANDASAYAAPTDAYDYPTEPAILYYFRFAKSGADSLISPVFTPASDGTAEWNDVIVPAAGTWTLTIRKDADDSQVATASVVVS